MGNPLGEDRSAVEIAYGLLWLAVTDDPRVLEARRRLLPLLDRDGKLRGVHAAMKMFGPVAEMDVRGLEGGIPSPSGRATDGV